MHEIIKLTAQTIGGEVQQTVNARELHAFLEVGKDFSTWIKDRIEKYGFIEGVDYVKIDSPKMGNPCGEEFSPNLGKNTSRGRPNVEYYISLSMGKELGMVERSDKGREIRQYFIRCEKELKEVQQQMPALPDFTNPAIAARAWAEQYEKNQALIEQSKKDAPKVKWCDRVIAANEHMTITQAAKTLGYPPRKFKDYLRQIGFIYTNADTPMQEQIKTGRAVLRYAHYTSSEGNPVEKPYTHITSKGLKWLYEKLVNDGLIERQQDLFEKTA